MIASLPELVFMLLLFRWLDRSFQALDIVPNYPQPALVQSVDLKKKQLNTRPAHMLHRFSLTNIFTNWHYLQAEFAITHFTLASLKRVIVTSPPHNKNERTIDQMATIPQRHNTFQSIFCGNKQSHACHTTIYGLRNSIPTPTPKLYCPSEGTIIIFLVPYRHGRSIAPPRSAFRHTLSYLPIFPTIFGHSTSHHANIQNLFCCSRSNMSHQCIFVWSVTTQ